ncbi:NAD-dependent dihydropyrimidine dehydrogenase subunit PreA [Tundrisphaera sp. TA3]|uniref:NAD-dependent dihydropyrimidine dehydrogenase subunit PreA n=1 Tax=Tundrisphaera sp. TA3 TaxID=3435775 RepID=UPI003EC0A1CC
MPDLSSRFCGIASPNPFWLASAPPTNSEYQVRRAFDAGWGGAVWKTLGHEPIVNVSSRYGAIDHEGRKVIGLNNIELITDRPLAVNLAEIARTKKAHPRHALIVSLMVESNREAWHDITKQTQDAGADGIELNFGCPHGMSERGMGSAVGQVPEYAEMITGWVKEVATIPVIVKLTPNVADVRPVARAAVRGGADGLSLINTINSVMGVDLETLAPKPSVGGLGTHGGYCGPAVRPIALNMVAALANDPAITVPISGIGGVGTWQDAAEFFLLGASSVQACTAVMHHGFRIIDGLVDGLSAWMRRKGFDRLDDFIGLSSPRLRTWGDLDLNHKVVAEIDQAKCIHCGLCYIACEDGCHQSIRWDKQPFADFVAATGVSPTVSGGMTTMPGAGGGMVNLFTIKPDTCVGCNMCSLVCPVSGCITMKPVDTGRPPMSWNQYQARLAAGTVEPIRPPEHA